jgi:hypothetical protein
MSRPHPFAAVTIVVVPLDEDGRPVPSQTVTVVGIGGVQLEDDDALIKWRLDRVADRRFTVIGLTEWI